MIASMCLPHARCLVLAVLDSTRRSKRCAVEAQRGKVELNLSAETWARTSSLLPTFPDTRCART
eukprot:10062863-Alexandrium_andersonii.AAC.1